MALRQGTGGLLARFSRLASGSSCSAPLGTQLGLSTASSKDEQQGAWHGGRRRTCSSSA